MTPQERQLITDLFDRLAALENAPHDPDAARAIGEGLERAPNAVYPLVQTVLVQDEALKQRDAYIRDLEQQLGIAPEQPQRQGGFLENMRDSLFGRTSARGSVPSVGREPMGVPPGFGGGAPPPGAGYAGMQAPPRAGGSFLGTAAAAAAGVIGGSLLLDSLRGVGGLRPGGHGAFDPDAAGGSRAPWGGGETANSDLARQAGVDEVGRGGGDAGAGGERRASLFGDDDTGGDQDAFDVSDGGDFDSGGGDSDTA